MKVCSKCNTINSDDKEYCTNCGEKLPMVMIATVCPRCGKVNALGTGECSVCHHRLSGIHPEKMTTKIELPKHNKKTLKILAIVSAVIGIALFAFLTQRYSTNDYNYVKYMGIKITYYDKKLHAQGQAYYVIKGDHRHSADKPFSLNVAYLGNRKRDERKFITSSLPVLVKLYNQNSHYQLRICQEQAMLTGPMRIKLNVKERTLVSNGRTPISAPKARRSVQVDGNSRIKYMKMQEIIPSSS